MLKMKNALKIIFTSLLSIILLALLISYISYSRYWAKDPKIDVTTENLGYFHETYEDCRGSFNKSVQGLTGNFDSIQTGKFFVKQD